MGRAKIEVNDSGYAVFQNSGKLVHRWVAEKKYGEDAIKGKEVHHIDGDKRHFEDSNLLLVSKEDHRNIHKYVKNRKLIYSAILFLTFWYGFNLLMNNLNVSPSQAQVQLSMMRLSVLGIFFLAMELRYKLVTKIIRYPKDKYIILED